MSRDLRWAAILGVTAGLGLGCGESSEKDGSPTAQDASATGGTDTGPVPDSTVAPGDAAEPSPPPRTLAMLRIQVDDATLRDAATRFFEFVPETNREIGAITGGEVPDAVVVTLEVDPALCGECFRVAAPSATRRTLQAGGVLGAHYALAESLERLGWAFPHPLNPVVRTAYRLDVLEADATALSTPFLGTPHIPRRGLHLHTLHPIESLDAFWLPGAQNLRRARQMLDWMVKQRANFVEWVALGDIERPAAHGPWKTHTQAILADAQALGLETGLGIQLFGTSNLQKAFDLLDDLPESREAAEQGIEARLRLLTDDLPFDLFNLSFGEFSGVEPSAFVENVDLAYAVLKRLSPDAEMATTIHVGDSEDLRVDYRGESLLYYFLVKFANPEIEPWVHTVMFYNLYDSAGGAYHHDEFDEHRTFLEERLAAGEPVGYFPETAYWIAFDNSVPQWLPLYQTSRRLDLDRIDAQGVLSSHVLFSSGWEWGYWAHDADALRRSYDPASAWPQGATLRAELNVGPDAAPESARAQAWAELVEQVGGIQRQSLMLEELAPYTAGRDFYVDAGEMAGIIAAPLRTQFDTLVAGTDEARAQFQTQVLEPLRAYGDALDAAYAASGLLSPAERGPYEAELADGARIALLRPRYMVALYEAALAHAEGRPWEDRVARADALLEEARVVVAGRHGRRHDGAAHLTTRWPNPTIYQFGYLHQPDSLCMWGRERIQLLNALQGRADIIPNCAI